jgi:hypothetical protein
MKNLVIGIFLFTTLLQGRCQKTEILNKEVLSLKISVNSDNAPEKLVTDRDFINKIVETINGSNNEIAKFRGNYILIFNYGDSSTTAYVNDNCIKIDQHTYCNKENIQSKVENFLKNIN